MRRRRPARPARSAGRMFVAKPAGKPRRGVDDAFRCPTTNSLLRGRWDEEERRNLDYCHCFWLTSVTSERLGRSPPRVATVRAARLGRGGPQPFDMPQHPSTPASPLVGSQLSAYGSEGARSRYLAFSRLQTTALLAGEALPIPEIVAVGGQSDGKSTLLEALLGFRFNVRETEMGTRRPLVVQMFHDPDAHQPRCHLQEEDSEEYGPPIEPETGVADVIRARTEAWLRRTGGGAVHSKPIVMRAESAHCPNLTIIDTPGFILKARSGEPASTPSDIQSMVVDLMRPRHRIILFLQQSSVEWCSSLWLDVIKEVDPDLRRTIMVVSKFDNRMREFRSRAEVDQYLSARGYLPAHVHPFFVALPRDRSHVPAHTFREQVRLCDADVLAHLRTRVEGGFDEAAFGPLVGLASLRGYLEDELAARYQAAAPGVVAALRDRTGRAEGELAALEARLARASDVGRLREAAAAFIAAAAGAVCELMAGGADPDPGAHGMTSAEELALAGGAGTAEWQWRSDGALSRLRLHGGAAFERCLREGEESTKVLQYPSISQEEICTVLLNMGARSLPSQPPLREAASEVARRLARRWLRPALAAVCQRAEGILGRAWDLACVRLQQGHPAEQEVRPYPGLHASLRAAYIAFVSDLSGECQGHLDHLMALVASPFSEAVLQGITVPDPDPWMRPKSDALEPSVSGHCTEPVTAAPLSQDGGVGRGDGDASGAAAGEKRRRVGRGRAVARARGASDARDGADMACARDGGAADQLSSPRSPVAGVKRTRTTPAGGPGTPGAVVPGSPVNDAPCSPLATDRAVCAAPGAAHAGTAVVSCVDQGLGPALAGGASAEHVAVRQHVYECLYRIREALLCRLAPAALRECFLTPLSGRLGAVLSRAVLCGRDSDVRALFASGKAVQVLQAQCEERRARVEGLRRMTAEFEETAGLL